MPAHAELVGHRRAFHRHLLALSPRKQLTLHRLRRSGCCRFLFFCLATAGIQRLRTLRIVPVDGHGLQPHLPRLNVRVRDVFDRRFLGHVDGLRNRARKERLRRRHHLHVPGPGDRSPAALRCQRAIEHRIIFHLQVWRAFDFSVFVDVGNDLARLLRRVAQLHQRLWHGIVHDFDQSAAHQLLVFHQRQVRLDPCRVAIHHEPDGARRRQHGYLRILIAILFAVFQRRVP